MKKTTTMLRSCALAGSLAVLLVSPAFSATDDEGKEKPETVDTFAASNSLAGNYLAARIAATDKDTDFAVKFYRRALQRDPENRDLKLKAFLNFIANGDFTEGVEIGRDLEKAGNAPQIIYLILAAEEIRKRNWAGADKNLSRNWQSPLDKLIGNLLLSWVRLAQDKPEEALDLVDSLKGQDWYSLFKQYHGGLLALAAGKTDEAVKRLQNAVDNTAGGAAARDTYSRVFLALAKALRQAKKTEDARDIIQTALDRQPQNPVFEMAKSDLENNRPAFFQVKKPTRGAAEVFLNLGTAINREGGEQFARIYMQLASLLTPKDNAILSSLGEIYDKESKLARANAAFNQIEPASAYSRFARLEVALNLDELGKEDEAREIMDALVAENPDDLITHLSYGAVLARHEKFAEAIEIYKKIIERIPKPERIHWNLFYRLGIAYERTKQWPFAEKTFKQALELYPDQPSVLNYLGYSWVDMKVNLQEGLDMIRKAVEIRPNDGYMVDSLGWAFYRLNRFPEAVVELERAVELRPGDPTINDHLGDAYWRANRRLEAVFQWRHALALDPPKADIARIEEKLAKGLDEVLKREAAEAKDEQTKPGKEG